MRKQGIAHGAIILAVASVLVKVIGAVFKIPIGAILGPEGMASFSIAYNIYALMFVIATAGIPVAVSKMVAERQESKNKILNTILPCVAIFGLIVSAVLFSFAGTFAKIMGSIYAKEAICAISPAIFFVSIASVLRGYHQGNSNMLPTALSEVIEALGKLAFGLATALILLRRGAESHTIAAGAVVGVSIGAMISAFFLLVYKRNKVLSEKALQSKRSIIKVLLKNAIPITLGASVTSLSNVIDSALIMQLLQKAGFGVERAMWLFGSYNYATAIFNLPNVVVTTLGISLIPSIASARGRGKSDELNNTIEASLKIALSLAFAAAFGLFALGIEVMFFLYGGSVEKEAIIVAGKILAILSLSIPLLTMSSLSSSILQALGDVKTPMYSMLFGAVIKILFNLILVSSSSINIYGACISTFFSYAFTTINNVYAMSRRKDVKLSYLRIFSKPLFSGLLTGVTAKSIMYISSVFISTKLSLVFSIIGGAFVCLLMIFLLKTVTKGDKTLLFLQKSITIF